jgi:DNA-binding XRE family transcriptional regulator
LLFQSVDNFDDGLVSKPIGAGKTRRTNTPRELFGSAITRLRIDENTSQSEVAGKVGCDEYYLRNIEQGKENLTFDVMYAIVAYYRMLPLSRFWAYAESVPSVDPLAS